MFTLTVTRNRHWTLGDTTETYFARSAEEAQAILREQPKNTVNKVELSRAGAFLGWIWLQASIAEIQAVVAN